MFNSSWLIMCQAWWSTTLALTLGRRAARLWIWDLDKKSETEDTNTARHAGLSEYLGGRGRKFTSLIYKVSSSPVRATQTVLFFIAVKRHNDHSNSLHLTSRRQQAVDRLSYWGKREQKESSKPQRQASTTRSHTLGAIFFKINKYKKVRKITVVCIFLPRSYHKEPFSHPTKCPGNMYQKHL